eukprot:SAG11_NODE_293_length_11144_cov_4.661928_2_plen_796_part_00
MAEAARVAAKAHPQTEGGGELSGAASMLGASRAVSVAPGAVSSFAACDAPSSVLHFSGPWCTGSCFACPASPQSLAAARCTPGPSPCGALPGFTGWLPRPFPGPGWPPDDVRRPLGFGYRRLVLFFPHSSRRGSRPGGHGAFAATVPAAAAAAGFADGYAALSGGAGAEAARAARDRGFGGGCPSPGFFPLRRPSAGTWRGAPMVLDLLPGTEAYAGGFPRHFGSAGPERVHPRRTFQAGDAPYCERDCAGGRLHDVVRYFFGVPSPVGCSSVSQLTVLPHGLRGADLSSLFDRPGVLGHCGDRCGLHAYAGSRFSFSQFTLWAQVSAPAVDAFSAPGDICFALWAASPPRWFSRPSYSTRLLSRRYFDNEPDAGGLSPRYSYGGQFAALSGLLLAEDKCETVPTQQIEFLGLVCSTTDMMFYVPSKKRRNFVADTRRLLQLARHRHIQLRQLAGWIGKARALGDAVVHSRRRTRSCLRCLNGALASGARWGHFVRLQRPALAELQWWLHTAEAWKGSGIMIPTHDVSIDTDAGPWAWGGFLGQQSAGGFWSRRQLSRLSQNHKELLGVFFTLQAFEEQLVGKTVLVQTDNKSVISYLMKGGGRSESLSLKAEEVFDWCQRRQIRLRCVHLRGVLNVRADRVSRLYESRSEYQLRPACFRQLQRLHGPMDVDLFAARHNHLLPRYFSLLRDSAAVGQDAFQQDWSRLRDPFANPPYALISRVLRQARRQRVPRFTLIAPDWGAPWAPDLWEMALAPPTLLPDTVTAPLLQPSLPTPWPAHPPRWKTYAWLLSGSF